MFIRSSNDHDDGQLQLLSIEHNYTNLIQPRFSLVAKKTNILWRRKFEEQNKIFSLLGNYIFILKVPDLGNQIFFSLFLLLFAIIIVNAS